MKKSILVIGLLISILFTSVVYSSFNTSLQVSGEAVVRSIQNIRIDDVRLTNHTGTSYEKYNSKYTKDTTSLFVVLPANTSMTYEIDITNKNSGDYLIDSIEELSNTNSNVVVTKTLNINDIINGNSVKTFTITITNNTGSTEEETLVYKYGFRENLFTVTFDANGGSVSQSSKQVSYGSTYGTLPTPTRSGYTFSGWNGKNIFNIDNISYEIFNGENSTHSNSAWVLSDYIPIDSNENYIFSYTNPDGSTTYNQFKYQLYDENKTYISGYSTSNWSKKYTNAILTSETAKYIRINYSVYVSGGEAPRDYVQFEKGTTVTAYEPYYIISSTDVVQPKNHTLKAVWEANTYTVTFDANGGSVSTASKQVAFDSPYGELPTPTRTGYTFKGWTNENNIVHYSFVDSNSQNAVRLTNSTYWATRKYALNIGEVIDFDISFSNNNIVSVDIMDFVVDSSLYNNLGNRAYGEIVITNNIRNKYFTSRYKFMDVNVASSVSGYSVIDFGIYTRSTTLNQISSDHTLIAVWVSEMTNNKIDYDYTGAPQEFIVPKSGTYKLEIWGAQGGGVYPGYGGYSTGTINLSARSSLYVTTGGAGVVSTAATNGGGYNGGGNGTNYNQPGAGGGGATHIATTNRAELYNYDEHRSEILIVAGGGGGSTAEAKANYGVGGSGGGFIGNDGGYYNNANWSFYGTGGTQNEGGVCYLYGTSLSNTESFGSFGRGGDHGLETGTSYGGSGGGAGYYGGGGTSRNHGQGGGGSGYIGNSNLSNKYMYCYNCQTDTNTNTYTKSDGTSSCHLPTPTSDCAKEGNGYARITFIE